MAGLNKVQLIGNLGADPEVRYTPSGTKIASFRVAVNRRWKNPEGEQKEATDWFTVEAWGGLAEICENYLKKGSLVYVEGRLQTDQYVVEGEKRYKTKVVAREMQMLGGKPGEAEASASDISEEEIPF